MEDNKIVFIIPLYNEENTISEVIVNCKKFGDVFAINDCSSDKSLELLKKLNIRYINNATNLGYEKSLFFGLEYVYKNFNYEYFISIDGDGQFDLTSIEQAVKKINKNKLFFSSIRKKKIGL
mgnify:CR=1 FL=1